MNNNKGNGMIVVRKTKEKVADGRWVVSSYHQKAEVLTKEQRKGTIEVSEIPPKPKKPGYRYQLVIDDVDQLDWFEVKVDTHEKTQLIRLIEQGKISLEDLDDEVKQELADRVK
jgi:hypothetical protein